MRRGCGREFRVAGSCWGRSLEFLTVLQSLGCCVRQPAEHAKAMAGERLGSFRRRASGLRYSSSIQASDLRRASSGFNMFILRSMVKR